MAFQRYPDLPKATNFITGTGASKWSIPLGPLYQNLDVRTTAGLPGFHVFIESNQTGRFAGKSKLICWKTYFASSDDIKEAFIELGKSELPSSDTEAKLE